MPSSREPVGADALRSRRSGFFCRLQDFLTKAKLTGLPHGDLLYAARHVRACTIRPAEPEDYAELQQLHDRHAGTRIPYGYSKLFRKNLEDPAVHSLVCELASGDIVACGGISYTRVDAKDLETEQDYSMAYLSFGIVHAEHQRQGYGSTMLFARLAMLQVVQPSVVALSATQCSMPWFTTMGVEWASAEKDRNGSIMHTGSLIITASEIDYIRSRLWWRGVKLPKERLLPTPDRNLSPSDISLMVEELDALVETLPGEPRATLSAHDSLISLKV